MQRGASRSGRSLHSCKAGLALPAAQVSAHNTFRAGAFTVEELERLWRLATDSAYRLCKCGTRTLCWKLVAKVMRRPSAQAVQRRYKLLEK